MSDRTLTPPRNQMRHKGMKSEVKKNGGVQWNEK